jgi:hypothetical protein
MIKLNTVQKYGIVDLIFAILYLSIFIFILPAHDTLASVLTIGLPLILLIGGGYMVYGGKFSREVGLGLATLYLTITLFSLILLAYTIGYFKGIYGPMGKGITIVSYLGMIFVIQFFAVWPFFQIKALFKPLKKRKLKKKTEEKEEEEEEEEENVIEKDNSPKIDSSLNKGESNQ